MLYNYSMTEKEEKVAEKCMTDTHYLKCHTSMKHSNHILMHVKDNTPHKSLMQAYTTKLNAALEKCPSEIQSKDILEILADINSVPDDVRGAVNFNGGGFDNHRLFWNSMKSNGGGSPGGAIADAINASFGSFDAFKEKFSATTAVIQGSGWGWLVYNKSSSKVEYLQMPNQTSPRTKGLVPLLGCDVWEHAYYLQYQNKRPDYI